MTKTGIITTLACKYIFHLILSTLNCRHRFVDRDMVMRYRGGGVGHKVTRERDAALKGDSYVMADDIEGGNQPELPVTDGIGGDLGEYDEEELEEEEEPAGWSDPEDEEEDEDEDQEDADMFGPEDGEDEDVTAGDGYGDL
jgi:hypothetical protein